MIAVASQHMFWNAPRPPMLQNGRFRTIPMRLSGRPISMNGLFMGQATSNRLDGISIQAIIGRIQIQPGIQAFVDSIKNPPVFGRGSQAQAQAWNQIYAQPEKFQGEPPPNFPPMTDTERQTLLQIDQNPTDDEQKDLATIDSVFNQDFDTQGYTTTMDICYLTTLYSRLQSAGVEASQMDNSRISVNRRDNTFGEVRLTDQGLPRLMDYLVPFQDPLAIQTGMETVRKPGDTSFTNDKFYCTDLKSTGSDIPFSTRFGIDPKKTWGEVKQAVENALIIQDVFSKYPFPPPIDTAPDHFWAAAADQLPKIANIGQRVDPEAVSAWMTLTTLENYNAMSDQIVAEAAARARQARRNAWLTFGISLLASILVPFILPGVIASAASLIKLAISTVIDINARAAAAKQLADASKMFAADAPAFAAQVQKTADMLDSATAQAQASKPLTPDMQAAVNDIKQGMPAAPVGTYVVGGVAAAGVIAAIFALVR